MPWNSKRIPEMRDRCAIAAYGNEDRDAVSHDDCANNPYCILEGSGGESTSVEDEDRDLDQRCGNGL